MSLIEEVYQQMFAPGEVERTESEAYKEAKGRAFQLAVELNDQLGKKQIELWDQYTDALSEMSDIRYQECFRQGVVFGARFVTELNHS